MHSLYYQAVDSMDLEHVNHFEREAVLPIAFSLFHYVDGQLVCVESVNAPVDHMMSRKLLEAGRSPEPAVVADAAVPLKNHLL